MQKPTQTQKLSDKKVAILATDGFEEAELLEPKKALDQEGADVEIISLKKGSIKSWSKQDWGKTIKVDKGLDAVSSHDYDALVLPGGVINADKLRMEPEAVAFVKEFAEDGKPIAVICHGSWILIEAGQVKDRTLTSWPSLKTDLQNAGARWVDQEVVTDQGWVSSRKPDDIPAFNQKMIEEFYEGRHRPKTLESRQNKSNASLNQARH